MHKWLFIGLGLILTACSFAAQASAGGRTMDVAIVTTVRTSWLADHAASELASYVKQLTGIEARLVGSVPPSAEGGVVLELVVGPAPAELLALQGSDEPERLRDGFVVLTTGPGHLRLAAAEPIGLLYAVYDYLERQCGVGFFWDGEQVPKLKVLPTEGIATVELPRWPRRHFGLSDGFGITKFHHHFRTKEQREAILDWMAKRRLNLTAAVLMPQIASGGESSTRVYGLDDTVPDNWTYSGWPGALDFPAKTRTKLTKDQLDYGRERGIKWFYYLSYGSLPHQFRETHPELRLVGNLGYSATMLYPDDPEAARWTEAFYRDLIETYGTDHIYQDTPFVESTGASSPEESFELKLKAAKLMCESFKKLDPQAVWQSDSWDFSAVPSVWTDERIKRYFESLPRDMMFFYDTVCDWAPFYERTNYFHGTDWSFGILHSFQGDDHLHGNLADLAARMKATSQDPKATGCKGVYQIPEITGHNLLFFDAISEMAWAPDSFEVDEFLTQYATRRYGKEEGKRLEPALEALVKAVYSGGGWMPIYKKLGCWYGTWWWPIVGEKEVDDKPEGMPVEFEALHNAVEIALSRSEQSGDNPLYVTDLADWARTYLQYVFNWAVLDAYKALRQGDAARVHTDSAICRAVLKRLEAILSTQPSYHLQPQIERVMAVPGVNPYTEWFIKQHQINDLYASNELFEQLHWYYGPRMEVYLRELEARADRGETKLEWADIQAECDVIQQRWLGESIAVPESEWFQGGTIEAVEAAWQAFGDFRPVTDLTEGGSSASLRELGNVQDTSN